MRYLGFQLDRRMSFNAHWHTTAASAKRVIGAISRTIHRDPRALRYLFKERVVPMLLHSLPYCPPTTLAAWKKADTASSFTSHLLTNKWLIHGHEVIRAANLQTAGELCFFYSMKFLYKAWQGRRKYGLWIEPRHEDEDPPVRVTRSQSNRGEKELHGHELRVPQVNLEALKRMHPHRIIRVWNELPFTESGIPAATALRSMQSFSTALPHLFASLPDNLKRFYGHVDHVIVQNEDES